MFAPSIPRLPLVVRLQNCLYPTCAIIGGMRLQTRRRDANNVRFGRCNLALHLQLSTDWFFDASNISSFEICGGRLTTWRSSVCLGIPFRRRPRLGTSCFDIRMESPALNVASLKIVFA